MDYIKFSLIVPIYNVEEYLPKCLESLVNQSYRNIEIILVNDGSPDKCPQICDNYAKKDNRIHVFHKENGGLSDARNYGLKVAKGEYVIFVDSDDYIEIDTCKTISEILQQSPDVDIIASNIKSNMEKEVKFEMYTNVQQNEIIKGSDFLKLQIRNNTMFMSACRNIYRRQFLIDNELYFKVGILHEDEQWTPRVFLVAKSMVFTEYAHYIRVIREGSITRQVVKTKNAIDLMETVKELYNVYAYIEDDELRKLLNDYLVMLYLNAFYIGKMYQKKYRKYINENFLKENAISKRNLIKVSLFCFNKRIYYIVNRILKIISNV